MQARHGRRSNAAPRSFVLPLAALLCCWNASLAKDAVPPPPARIPESSVMLAGNIDQAMVQRFYKAISEREVTTVYIASGAGGEIEAMQIAEVMRARNMDVVVRAACAGPCAHLIFVAGKKRRIEGEALVAFGSSAAGLVSLLQRLGDNVPRDFRPDARWRDLAAAEESLYKQAGVSPTLLMDTQVAQQPRCLIFNRRDGIPDGANMQLSYAMWVPTRKQLSAAGLEFEGFWPKSRKEMLRIAAPILESNDRPDPERYVRFGDTDNLRSWREVKYTFKQLQACTLEEDEHFSSPPAEDSPAGE